MAIILLLVLQICLEAMYAFSCRLHEDRFHPSSSGLGRSYRDIEPPHVVKISGGFIYLRQVDLVDSHMHFVVDFFFGHGLEGMMSFGNGVLKRSSNIYDKWMSTCE